MTTLLVAQQALAPGAEVCGGDVGDSANPIVWVTDFSLSAAPAPIRWPGVLKEAKIVICRRDSLMLSTNDRYVLDELGVPFAVSDGDRMLWLYRVDGWIRTHMDSGALTPEENRENERMLAVFNSVGDQAT